MTDYTLHTGKMEEVLRTYPDDHFDSCVTDPPYGLTFMGKHWDKDGPSVEQWKEILRALKPGAYLLAFGGSRTHHRQWCRIEDAGFEIRDTIMWIYGQGFPKSHNLDGKWEGYGTALKPAHEPICLARKPLVGTVRQNMDRFGVGALNIEESRIDVSEDGGRPHRVSDPKASANGSVYAERREAGGGFDGGSRAEGITQQGRWPANVIHDGSESVMDQFPDAPGQLRPALSDGTRKTNKIFGVMYQGSRLPDPRQDSSSSAARFFYQAKASRTDREEGLDGFMKKPDREVRNHHPTVKPTKLMTYLIRLTTPPGGVILDPFMGSGSTGKACMLAGYGFHGIDMDAEYVAIAEARIRWAIAQRGNQLDLGL